MPRPGLRKDRLGPRNEAETCTHYTRPSHVFVLASVRALQRCVVAILLLSFCPFLSQQAGLSGGPGGEPCTFKVQLERCVLQEMNGQRQFAQWRRPSSAVKHLYIHGRKIWQILKKFYSKTDPFLGEIVFEKHTPQAGKSVSRPSGTFTK